MRVVVHYNPSSGRGDGEVFASLVTKRLAERGIDASQLESQRRSIDIEKSLDSSLDYMVIIGGDGTVLPYLEPAAKFGIPLFVLPGGNESLFSKAFGVTRDLDALLASIENGKVTHHFFAIAESGEKKAAFFSMLSVGLDSFVVADIAARRRGPIGKRGYLIPIVRQFFRYKAPLLTIKVDGVEVIKERRGTFVLANHSTYAGNLAIVPEASSLGESLRLRFFPEMPRRRYLSWGLPYLLKRGINLKGTELLSGKLFEISSKQGAAVQLDGDYLADTPVTVYRSRHRVPILELAN